MATEFGYFPQKPTAGDHFIVEDLLDFSHDDNAAGAFDTLAPGNSNSVDSPASSVDVAAFDSCNSSSFSFPNDVNFPPVGDFNFAGDLCVPHDDLAELEWLSNFVEESFSGMSAFKARPDNGHHEARFHHHGPPPAQHPSGPAFSPDVPVPGKARSKRSRAAPGSWASRLVHITSEARPGPKKAAESGAAAGGEVRRCLHCASEKTPQWRAGPLGPKTLCNACGVRYKSGRLVPEYRPAASPTFVQAEHSNSHRKVVELRRQKEMMRQQQMHQQMLHYPNTSDYMIHQQIGSDFRKPV